jgi:hypothetical protein
MSRQNSSKWYAFSVTKYSFRASSFSSTNAVTKANIRFHYIDANETTFPPKDKFLFSVQTVEIVPVQPL